MYEFVWPVRETEMDSTSIRQCMNLIGHGGGHAGRDIRFVLWMCVLLLLLLCVVAC